MDCKCFICDVVPQVSKLDPNALKCIFLGYSHVQKGYQCYCPILGLYFVPVDVTFFDISLFSLSSIVTSRGGGERMIYYCTLFPHRLLL